MAVQASAVTRWFRNDDEPNARLQERCFGLGRRGFCVLFVHCCLLRSRLRCHKEVAVSVVDSVHRMEGGRGKVGRTEGARRRLACVSGYSARQSGCELLEELIRAGGEE